MLPTDNTQNIDTAGLDQAFDPANLDRRRDLFGRLRAVFLRRPGTAFGRRLFWPLLPANESYSYDADGNRTGPRWLVHSVCVIGPDNELLTTGRTRTPTMPTATAPSE